MLPLRFFSAMFSSGLLILATGPASSQGYPVKPVRMLATTIGGIADIVGRLIAQGIAGPLGQQVIVDNRPGVVGLEITAKAVPDGYTLLASGPSMWISPLLGQKISFDPIADFAPVTLAVSSPSILVVHPALPVASVKDLISLAKARPGDLNYASGLTGGTPHLAAELLRSMAGIRITRIPYKGSTPALTDLIAGNVQLMIAPVASAMAQVKSRRVRALAVTSAQPSALAPGLPAVAASLPGYEMLPIVGIFTPVGTPAPIVDRLNQEIVRVLNVPDIRERLLNNGVETIGSSPQQLSVAIKSEVVRLGKVIREAGIRGEE
jgi:tripartite-type tricarboxylate transporter receptor subunit TctC